MSSSRYLVLVPGERLYLNSLDTLAPPDHPGFPGWETPGQGTPLTPRLQQMISDSRHQWTKCSMITCSNLVKCLKYYLLLPNVDAELALLLDKSMLEREMLDLRESLLSSRSDWVELAPSDVFLFTRGNTFLILSNKELLSSAGSISTTSLGGATLSGSAVSPIIWNNINNNSLLIVVSTGRARLKLCHSAPCQHRIISPCTLQADNNLKTCGKVSSNLRIIIAISCFQQQRKYINEIMIFQGFISWLVQVKRG